MPQPRDTKIALAKISKGETFTRNFTFGANGANAASPVFRNREAILGQPYLRRSAELEETNLKRNF